MQGIFYFLNGCCADDYLVWEMSVTLVERPDAPLQMILKFPSTVTRDLIGYVLLHCHLLLPFPAGARAKVSLDELLKVRSANADQPLPWPDAVGRQDLVTHPVVDQPLAHFQQFGHLSD
jgi:hypothetical protein